MGIFRELELFFRLLKYKGRYKRAREALGFIPDIRSTGETLRRLNDGACSISRFGDGEFNLLRGRGNGFCRYHAGLAERLREVLTVPVEGHVVGIPRALVCQENFYIPGLSLDE